jgi:hypothetical protein
MLLRNVDESAADGLINVNERLHNDILLLLFYILVNGDNGE